MINNSKKAISEIVVIILLLIISVLAITVGYVIVRNASIETAEQYQQTEVIKETNVTVDLSYLDFGIILHPPRDHCDSGRGWSTQYYETLSEERCPSADCCEPNVFEYVFDLTSSDEILLAENGFIELFFSVDGQPGGAISGSAGDSIRIFSSDDGKNWEDLYVGFSTKEHFLSNDKITSKTIDFKGTTYSGREIIFPISNKFRYIKLSMPRTYLTYGEIKYFPFKFQPIDKRSEITYESIFTRFYPLDPDRICHKSDDDSTWLVTLEQGKGYVIEIVDDIVWQYCKDGICESQITPPTPPPPDPPIPVIPHT